LIDQIVERFIEYSTEFGDIFCNYIKTYGQECVILLQETSGATEDFAKAFGQDRVGFDVSLDKYTKYKSYVIFDFSDYQRIETLQDPTVVGMILDNSVVLTSGAKLQVMIRGYVYTYDMKSPVDQWQGYLYRVSLQLSTRKQSV